MIEYSARSNPSFGNIPNVLLMIYYILISHLLIIIYTQYAIVFSSSRLPSHLSADSARKSLQEYRFLSEPVVISIIIVMRTTHFSIFSLICILLKGEGFRDKLEGEWMSCVKTVENPTAPPSKLVWCYFTSLASYWLSWNIRSCSDFYGAFTLSYPFEGFFLLISDTCRYSSSL